MRHASQSEHTSQRRQMEPLAAACTVGKPLAAAVERCSCHLLIADFVVRGFTSHETGDSIRQTAPDAASYRLDRFQALPLPSLSPSLSPPS